MSYLIFDIETAAKSETELVFPEFEPSKVLKDPEKIAADIARKRQEYIDDSALHATRGYILAIGIMDELGNMDILQGDESDILTRFWGLYTNNLVRKFVGHNVKLFDIPFLIRRSWFLRVKVPRGVVNGRYLSDRIVDTMETWGCGNYRETISLSNLCSAFGIEGKSGSGKEFARLYKEGGEAKVKALEYLKNDLLITKSVAEKMGVI